MEESSEVHSSEKRASPEKSNRRRFKTPSQLSALENFYSEEKYPTEEMKSQIAEKLGLTEKQISGWFCHRRLKDKRSLRDEAFDGRQDRSSAVIQDLGSGFCQDSCGSTKQGDRRLLDPREVESERLYRHNSPSAELTHDLRSQYMGNVGGMDDTSSDNSSALQDRYCSPSTEKYDMHASGFIGKTGVLPPPNSMIAKKVKPSGYLKLKGEIEHAAITAVKRQLGRHYREDGPPLGIEFDPLPPGAFELPLGEPACESYYANDATISHSPELYAVHSRPNLNIRNEANNFKISSQKFYEEGANFSSPNRPDYSDHQSHRQSKQKYVPVNRIDHYAGLKPSSTMQEYSADDDYINHKYRNHNVGSKNQVELIRSDSARDFPYPNNTSRKSKKGEASLHDYMPPSPTVIQRSEKANFMPPNVDNRGGEGRLFRRNSQEIPYTEAEAGNEYIAPIADKIHPRKIIKRDKTKLQQEDYPMRTTFGVPRWGNQMKGSAVKMPSHSNERSAGSSSSLE